MPENLAEFTAFLEALKAHGVSRFRSGGLHVEFGPVGHAHPTPLEFEMPAEDEPSAEDILFYSVRNQ